MAAPVFEGASFNGGSGTSRVVSVPAGTTDGDQLLLIASCDLGASQNVTFGVSAAWDELLPLTRSSPSAAGTNLQVWTRVADSEPSSYTVTLSTSRGAIAAIVRVSGQDPVDAFDAIDIVPFSDATEAKIPSITTETDDCLVVGVSSWDESKTWNGVAPAGWSVGYNADHTTVGVSHDQAGVCRTQATAGATGVGQLELSSASPHVSAAIAIRPPQGDEPEPVEVDLGLATESGTANPLTGLLSGRLAMTTESGAVNALSGRLSGAFGVAAEIGTLHALSGQLAGTLGTAAETGVANALHGAASGTLGLVSEIGTVHALGELHVLGAVTETGTPSGLAGTLAGALDQVVESGTLNAVSGHLAHTLGVTTETGTVLALAGLAPGALRLIAETGTPHPLSGQLVGTMSPAGEVAALHPLTGQLATSLGLAAEDGAPNPLGGRVGGSLGLVVETGAVQPLVPHTLLRLGLVTESGELLPLRGVEFRVALGLVVEADRVRALVRKYPYTLPQKVLKVVIDARALKLRIP